MQPPHAALLPENAAYLPPSSCAFLAGLRRAGARAWPFAKSRHTGIPLREAGAWARRLNEEKESLFTLVRDTETEFLATGEGLKRLAQQLGKIQADCQSLTELTLGQGQDAPVRFAFQLLKKAEDLVLASYEQYDLVFATFAELQTWLADLRKQHNSLMRVLSPLDYITIAFRIEASRHSAEVRDVFYTLAADVKRTVDEVRDTLKLQFEELAASEEIVRAFMAQSSASVQAHREKVTATLASNRHQLHAMNEALTGSGAGAADLTRRNQAVMRHIGGMVMAQQCQDITRQKIEHVGEAMDEMRSHLDEIEPAAFPAESGTRQFILRAGQIQLHQIQNVFDELNRAAESVQSGIQGLHTDAGAASQVAVAVGAVALDANVASLCEANIGGILVIIGEAISQIAEILAAFEPLQARFINCTSKAAELALNVRHDALNAQIFAIRSSEGATLEVLAGRMRLVSDETIREVELFGGELRQTAEIVNNLCQRLVDFQHLAQTEQKVLVDESALSRNQLLELDRAIPLLIGRITGQQAAFAQSAEKVLAQVQFPLAVAEASTRSISFFNDLVAWGGAGKSRATETAASRQIDRLKANYTMESERHAHAAVSNGILAPMSETVSGSTIDLFDEWDERLPAAVGSSGAPESYRSDDHTLPAALAVMGPVPSMPKPALTPAEATASEVLGDNVELF